MRSKQATPKSRKGERSARLSIRVSPEVAAYLRSTGDPSTAIEETIKGESEFAIFLSTRWPTIASLCESSEG